MQLSLDELRLISEFRRLTPTGRDDLLAYASSLLRESDDVGIREEGNTSNQCSLKSVEKHPEADKTPIFTE